MPYESLLGPDIQTIVAYVGPHASSTKSAPTTIFHNMLSVSSGVPSTQAGPHSLPSSVATSLKNIHHGLPHLQMGSLMVCHTVSSRTYVPNEVRLADVYGTGDCGFCALLACVYPNEFPCPLVDATPTSCVLSYALRLAANLPASESALLQCITRKEVLQLGTMLGVHTTILEVADRGMRATMSTLPDLPMSANAMVKSSEIK